MGRSRRHDVDLTRGWVQEGTGVFVAALEALGDDAFTGASLLPGWSRSHVAAHTARNADALRRLATWARTGVENPMYPDAGTRDAEISEGAAEPAAALRDDVVTSAAALEQVFDALDQGSWAHQVRTQRGLEIRASVLPWMRVREVWLHAVDLDAGVGLDRAPAELLDELVTDVVSALSRHTACPSLLLRDSDGPGTWQLGPGSGAPAGVAPADPAGTVTVEGTTDVLAVWLTGRTAGTRPHVTSGGELPQLPAWL